MDDLPPTRGRPGRRFRREAARQWVKAQMSQDNQKPKGPKKYKTQLLWAVGSILVPVGWGEIMSGDQAAWRVIVGWVLWLVPLGIALHVLWTWSSEAGRSLAERILTAAAAMILFLSVSGYSVWSVYRPAFVFVWPGLTLADGRVQYYFAAERRKLFNLTVVVTDMNNPINNLSFKVPELDPERRGLAESFALKPANAGHEKIRILTQGRDVEMTVEDLSVSTRGVALFPAYRAVITKYGKSIFECQSKDFPDTAQVPDCGNNVFSH